MSIARELGKAAGVVSKGYADTLARLVKEDPAVLSDTPITTTDMSQAKVKTLSGIRKAHARRKALQRLTNPNMVGPSGTPYPYIGDAWLEFKKKFKKKY